jgi:hypothetical protein
VANYTKTIRRGLDKARKALALPQTVELLKRSSAGGYEDLYTVDGGWMITYDEEKVNKEKYPLITMVITDDREDFTGEVIEQVIGFRLDDLNYAKKIRRPTLSANPKYLELGFEAIGDHRCTVNRPQTPQTSQLGGYTAPEQPIATEVPCRFRTATAKEMLAGGGLTQIDQIVVTLLIPTDLQADDLLTITSLVSDEIHNVKVIAPLPESDAVAISVLAVEN